MSSNQNLKPLIPVIVGGLLLSILSTVIWFTSNSDRPDLNFGRVVSVATSSISIADKDDQITEVSFVESVRIERRGETLVTGDIIIGDFVQITGDQNEEGEIAAQSIRLLKPPKEGRSYEGNR